MVEAAGTARRLWVLVEHVHAVTYLGAEARAAYEGAGVHGFWRGYFAGRAAPLGAVGPGVVTAAFYGFHPAFVRRSVPDVWTSASPADLVAARQQGAAATLRAVAPDVLDGTGDDLAEVADVLVGALHACDPAGRPMFAANAELPVPTDPVERLWHATTMWREHRGDGHVAALVAAGVGGCASHVLRLADQGGDPATMQAARGWSPDEWDSTAADLRERGWLDASGSLTTAGRDVRRGVEAATDRAAAEPVHRLGDDVDRVAAALSPLAAAIAAADAVPTHVIGLPSPPPGGAT